MFDSRLADKEFSKIKDLLEKDTKLLYNIKPIYGTIHVCWILQEYNPLIFWNCMVYRTISIQQSAAAFHYSRRIVLPNTRKRQLPIIYPLVLIPFSWYNMHLHIYKVCSFPRFFNRSSEIQKFHIVGTRIICTRNLFNMRHKTSDGLCDLLLLTT